LFLELLEVYACSRQPRWGSCLEAPQFEAVCRQSLSESGTRPLSEAPPGAPILTRVEQAPEKCARRQDDRFRCDSRTAAQLHPGDTIVLDEQATHFSLNQRDPPKPPDDAPQDVLIAELVTLRSRAPHRWPARSVEGSELDPGTISRPALNASKGIDFGDKMTLTDTTYRRVARHLTNRPPIEGDQRD
jgi:hypothetical protein